MTNNLKKIIISASTTDFINAFLLDFIIALSKDKLIILVTNSSISEFNKYKNIIQVDVKFHRKLNFLSDIKNFFKCFLLIRNHSPTMVISFTPKVGLIMSIAAYLNRIQFRLHYFTGQIWALNNTPYHVILKLSDKLISFLSTKILCDSFSQKNFLLENNIISANKISVIHNGSIKGVDTNKFMKKIFSINKLKKNLNISSDSKIISIVSRLNKDKGIVNLPDILTPILKKYHNLFIILIGKDEENLLPWLYKNKLLKSRLIYLPYTDKLDNFLTISNILLITSFREGFGNIALEASSNELPIVSTNIYGLKDIVINGYNGLIYSNVDTATYSLELLLNNNDLCIKFGKNGRDLALSKYNADDVNIQMVKYINCFFND